MSVLQTVLVFVIIPLAIVGVVAALVRAGNGGAERQSRRYRPGRPYDFAPIWFLSQPERVGPAVGGRAPLQRAQTPAIERGIIEDATGTPVRPGPVGGASDRW